MKKQQLSLEEQLIEEQNAVSNFIKFFKLHSDLSLVIYDVWTAKDVLGHITSWHMSFDRNLQSVVKQEKPDPFKGSLTDVNEREVKKMKQFTTEELLGKIRKSQMIINENIINQSVAQIPYKRGSRNYSPIEHLEIVQRHINSHLKDLLKKYKSEEHILKSPCKKI